MVFLSGPLVMLWMRLLLASACLTGSSLIAAEQAFPRAPLPKVTAFLRGVFFEDAFRQGLVGERPAKLGQSREVPPGVGDPKKRDANPASQFAWSQLVSAESLEDEVKALAIEVRSLVTTLGRFRSGGYQDVRRVYSELAALFAVIAEFDGQVRWSEAAPTMRDRMARAAANAKVSSPQAFQETKQRKLDLEELVRGGSVALSPVAEKVADWEQVCDRGPLMERFTLAYDEGLAIWTATAAAFRQQRSAVKREAELLHVFAEILTREGMTDADDEDYAAYCEQLGEAAAAVLQAVNDDDQEAARKAASDIGKACVNCHDDYRG